MVAVLDVEQAPMANMPHSTAKKQKNQFMFFLQYHRIKKWVPFPVVSRLDYPWYNSFKYVMPESVRIPYLFITMEATRLPQNPFSPRPYGPFVSSPQKNIGLISFFLRPVSMHTYLATSPFSLKVGV
jgi:hypothetical protein